MTNIDIDKHSEEFNLEQFCFQIIALSGEALSLMMDALKKCREDNFKKVDELMEEATTILNKAHNVHTQLMVKEANGEEIGYSVLLAHAQDNLMNTILAKTFSEEMINMYKALKEQII